MARASSMEFVVKRTWTTRDFRLESGQMQASYFEIDTELGHVASGHEWAKWGPTLQRFVEALDR
jgi:hypothetical protein